FWAYHTTFLCCLYLVVVFFFVFFFTAPSPPEIYTLSLHDALPICRGMVGHWRWYPLQRNHRRLRCRCRPVPTVRFPPGFSVCDSDRKSTRLNSSHLVISYAVFCLKKKKKNIHDNQSHNNPLGRVMS